MDMGMGADDVARMERHFEKVFEKLDGLSERMTRQETLMTGLQTQSARMDDRLASVVQNGCAHYPQHQEIEERVGVLENDKQKILGWAAGAGVAAGGLGAWVRSWFGT